MQEFMAITTAYMDETNNRVDKLEGDTAVTKSQSSRALTTAQTTFKQMDGVLAREFVQTEAFEQLEGKFGSMELRLRNDMDEKIDRTVTHKVDEVSETNLRRAKEYIRDRVDTQVNAAEKRLKEEMVKEYDTKIAELKHNQQKGLADKDDLDSKMAALNNAFTVVPTLASRVSKLEGAAVDLTTQLKDHHTGHTPTQHSTR